MSNSSTSPRDHKVIKTACGMCIQQCGINVHLRNEKIDRIEGMPEHPHNRGTICAKARQIHEYVYSDDRLKYPLRKEDGRWKRISWEEALDTIVMRLMEDKERYGASSLGVLVGDPVSLALRSGPDLIGRFCDVYGTPNRFHSVDLCGSSRFRAYSVTVGKWCTADIENSKCIVIWGGNPHKSMPTVARRVIEAIRRGAKLIVIDPRRTPLAKRADVHVQPRPGSDGFLALAMLNTIVSEGLYDKEFVEKWTVGFDRLVEHVKRYTAQDAERVTGISAENINRMARVYANNRPACIQRGTKIEQCGAGFQTIRATLVLEAICGNIDIPGGAVGLSSGLRARPFRLPDKMSSMKLVGADRFPLAHQAGGITYGDAAMLNWADLVLAGEPYLIKSMVISGGNPLLMWPNSTKVRQALEKLEFLVIMDVFMTATADMADIVLPACTFLERLDLCQIYQLAGVPAVMLRRLVVHPLWESWSDSKFWLELARRMGYQEYFPWQDEEATLDYLLEPSGLTVKYLRDEHPTGIISGHKRFYEYKEKAFRTRSGKVELYSEELQELGYDPLPTYREPPESPMSTPELAKEYPLILTTGTRESEFWHSQHRNLGRLRQRALEPMAEIHPDTAREYGVRDGDVMIIETKRGSGEIRAKVTEDIIPNVVCTSHAWLGVNALTDDMPADPVSGYVPFAASLCRIQKRE
jgi:anaerobic selenocysteine-containing dehydrogenase